MADAADAKPTSGVLARYKDMKAQLTEVVGRLDGLLGVGLAEFNKAAAAAGIPAVVAK